ncbi:hypothetical protein ACFQ6N_34300 [Kitasatospora sp. NPDC056446]|uniref:hypothetical protein n=1 Tax=Kitasatospora sp. NPDC056446 TaxID=3345819 RepID=UPI00368EFF76
MATPDDPDPTTATALRDADSPSWTVRAGAGRRLAAQPGRIGGAAADALHRLLLDAHDTAVTQETAEALLARRDTAGLRCVLLALSRAAETWTADEIGAVLHGDPDWMTTAGADALIERLHALAADEDTGVRDEARAVLAGLRPREQWAREPDRDSS